MTTRSDYTDEEWTYLTDAPIMAGMYISAIAGSGSIDSMKKEVALAHAVGELMHRGSANELIATLIDELNRREAEAFQTRTALAIDIKRLDSLQATTLGVLQQAAAVLSKARREEAAEYKALVMSLSQRVAQVGKDGGFMGGTPVSEGDIRAIQEIGAALRTTA
ncbi:MAG TPA: hypothetical protein VFO07_08000 [Roseiflexaceae bacterium]|nr:hypothetical protein [Roseiflexaceae bacterium]